VISTSPLIGMTPIFLQMFLMIFWQVIQQDWNRPPIHGRER